ncbi:hypothetical protein NIES2100_75740 [Calothrix sp. NIES-2100]|uniref:hypothetical protein n=1 Tax=Calothrix sp. NIES-2100 TaxID=1954172 RepID=UPI000B5EE059|nr:hypothetical protein NIES2100_75740 [Calothrix sp. NIES-2100]
MLRLSMKSLALGGMVALSTATSAFAQIPVLQNLHLTQVPSFNCVPHLQTYTVKPLPGFLTKFSNLSFLVVNKS